MIYLDNQSTTPVDPRVVEAMAPCWTECFGNAASTSHAFGEEAASRVASSREQIAESLGASSREVVFTSGATESNNLAIFGVAQRHQKRHGAAGHVLTVATEHKAVLDPMATLHREGWERTVLPVATRDEACPGLIDLQQFEAAIQPNTVLASVMLANNEIGVIQPLAELSEICRRHDVLLHCDATQGVGKLPVDLDELGADLVSFTAHKIYGPKGVGALIVRNRRPRIRLAPQIVGGGHEQGRRSGTLNVPGIVGLAAALQLCLDSMDAERSRLQSLRDRLAARLQDAVPELVINGPPLEPELRLPGNLHCSFPGIDGEALMMNMPGVAVSSGSACTSANPEPSHVLRALQTPDDLSRAGLRFGLGRFTTEQQIDQAASHVAEAVARLKRLAS